MSASLTRLRKAEEEARLDIEAARRKAREIRMGIPEALQELRALGEKKLEEARDELEDSIQREVSEIHSRLDGRVEKRLEELSELRERLASTAAEKLAAVIRDAG
jgi:septation ring formation regulator EzrA